MIPSILHRIAIGEIPDSAERWWDQFAAMHPKWQLVTHLPSPGDFPETAGLWTMCQKPASQSDLMRYEILARYGGVYVDWDVEPVRPLDPLLGAPAFAGFEAPDRIGSAVLGFEPGHPAMSIILDEAKVRIAAGCEIMEAGPLLVTEVLEGRNDVLLLPSGSFYGMPWHMRTTTKDCEYGDPWAYAVHRCNASWMGLPQLGTAAQLRNRRRQR